MIACVSVRACVCVLPLAAAVTGGYVRSPGCTTINTLAKTIFRRQIFVWLHFFCCCCCCFCCLSRLETGLTSFYSREKWPKLTALQLSSFPAVRLPVWRPGCLSGWLAGGRQVPRKWQTDRAVHTHTHTHRAYALWNDIAQWSRIGIK